MGQTRRNRRIYFGWWLVAGLFIVLTISSGMGFYNLSVYINVLSQAHGFAVSEVSGAVSLFFLVGGIGGMWVARLFERMDVRLVMTGGAALGGLALALIGGVRESWQLYVLFALFGIGNSGVSIVTSTTLVTRWFPGPDRSVALSVASTGLSFGGVVLTPVSAAWLNTAGVETTMPWLGFLFFAAITPIAWLLVRWEPTERTIEGAVPLPSGPVWYYRDAIRTPFFLVVSLGFVLCMCAQVGGIAHLYNQAQMIAGDVTAARAVQILSVMSIVMRIAGGWIVRRMSLRHFALVNSLVQGAGVLIIALADSATTVLVGAAVFGSSVGNLLMLHPLMLAEVFGTFDYARIFSLSNAITVLGVGSGPFMLGLVYDFSSYQVAFGVAAILCLGSFLLMALARVPEVSSQ
ncbi:MAG: MFS transporter [Pseudomonadales bacterium]|mgnify:CR=1 FL=1|nr:MFS transporter [Pseudomonadales bacterium]MDP6470196.1 MFS transporter [Pseudomonadales bacterium]MDP6827102.1 MFS transporter [Pseudomonadales bacterium]MDP6971540.1 MFS transporter [Pseudomonadales bacterium]